MNISSHTIEQLDEQLRWSDQRLLNLYCEMLDFHKKYMNIYSKGSERKRYHYSRFNFFRGLYKRLKSKINNSES